MQTDESLPLPKSLLLNTNIPQTQLKVPSVISPAQDTSPSKQETTLALLDQLFPDQKREDKTIKQARAILGNLTEKFSMEELQEIIILFQYLTESWLDMFERELFDGKTLQELLNLG